MNVCIFNGAYSIFYLIHHKILMNIGTFGFGFARVQIKGIQISEGVLYRLLELRTYFDILLFMVTYNCSVDRLHIIIFVGGANHVIKIPTSDQNWCTQSME